MIKYAKVKGYRGLGEMGFMSHMYQWVNTEEDKPTVILVWRDSEQQKYWVGKLFIKSNTYVNEFEKEIDLSDLGGFGLVRTKDFMDFIKGNMHEELFNDFKLDEDWSDE